MGLQGFDATVFMSEFDTIRQTVLDEGSQLYPFGPDIVWILSNYRDVRADVKPNCPFDSVNGAVEKV